MKTPEGYEKDDICKYLLSLKAWWLRTFSAGFGKSGTPDILACIPVTITPAMVGQTVGMFVSIEVKREGKEPTKLQETRIEEIQASGGFAIWGTAAKVIPELEAWLISNRAT